ncbi:MAG: hypothetical protein LBH26_03965 [Treponema sp.]|jgi:hypothetical protein|nr:hypothetical protein [Treponema sp.]
MKNNRCFFRRMAATLVLVSVLALAGCQTGEEGDSAASCTLSFSAGEGSGTPPSEVTVQSGSTITLPGQGNMTAPAGKIFKGWSGDGGSYGGGTSYTVTKTLSFTAQWEGPAAPAGYQVSVKHLAQLYETEVISRIIIYKYDAAKANNQGDAYKTYNNLTVKYTETWAEGKITDNGKYVVAVIIDGINFTSRITLEVYEVDGTKEAILVYNGTNTLVSQVQ